MAKAGVQGTDALGRATELKRELQRLVTVIVDDDDYCVEDEAMRILDSLKKLKLKKNWDSVKKDNDKIPDEFRCPLSRKIMIDPVVLASGQTFERLNIERWLNQGHRTCPQSQQVLSHTLLTPNHLVREMIFQWCGEHGIELPKSAKDVEEHVIPDADRSHLSILLKKLSSSSISDRKQAAKELRNLTKMTPSFRGFFGEPAESITKLLNPLTPGKADADTDLQEDLITTLLNISIDDNNKKVVAENPIVIPLLVESLRSGTMETRRNAAAALFTLSALDSNKLIIGKSGALKPLIDLLDEGHPLAMKDVASAIFNLCIAHENKGRAVNEGAVKIVLKKIIDRTLVDELLSMLALLSSHHKAVEELGELDVVQCLLDVIRENTNDRNNENCVVILYNVCCNDRNRLRKIREDEDAKGTISELAQSGTSRAKRKASGILERLNTAVSFSHTA